MPDSDETSQPSDDRLLARVADGDQRAFAELVSRHGERARALALRYTGNAADADDIMQHAFWAAWRGAAGWQTGRAQFSTWLHRVVVNRCIDKSRRKAVRSWLPLGDATEPASADPDAEAIVDARHRLDAVRRDIVGLPPRQRAVLLLSVMQERSNQEIADMMNMSVGAVEQALVRARRRLREKMRDREDVTDPSGDKT